MRQLVVTHLQSVAAVVLPLAVGMLQAFQHGAVAQVQRVAVPSDYSHAVVAPHPPIAVSLYAELAVARRQQAAVIQHDCNCGEGVPH